MNLHVQGPLLLELQICLYYPLVDLTLMVLYTRTGSNGNWPTLYALFTKVEVSKPETQKLGRHQRGVRDTRRSGKLEDLSVWRELLFRLVLFVRTWWGLEWAPGDSPSFLLGIRMTPDLHEHCSNRNIVEGIPLKFREIIGCVIDSTIPVSSLWGTLHPP